MSSQLAGLVTPSTSHQGLVGSRRTIVVFSSENILQVGLKIFCPPRCALHFPFLTVLSAAALAVLCVVVIKVSVQLAA